MDKPKLELVKPVKNEEIAHVCSGCRNTIKKGEQIMTIFPIVVTPAGNKVAQIMVCHHCGVLTYLPDGSVQLPQVEQPKIILPH